MPFPYQIQLYLQKYSVDGNFTRQSIIFMSSNSMPSKKKPGFTGTQGIGVSDIPSGVDDEERLEADLNGLDNETANNDLDKQLSTITDFMLHINSRLMLYIFN